MAKYLRQHIVAILLLFILFTFSSCATYYVKNEAFNRHFATGDMVQAEKALDNNKSNLQKRNKSLYLLNKGMLAWLQKDYARAADYFHQADIYIEDQRKNVFNEGLALISNPATKPYRPEDFENVLSNFYQALSYLEMGKMGDALVECRRVNEKLYALNDKYPSRYQNRYSDDAFVHIVMGLIYDANNDYNNAFIAYRNAYKIYENNYTKNFNTPTPFQLKKDILRTAYLTGLSRDYYFYKRKFGMEYTPRKKNQGTLVFFWMNGLGPVKDEWSINFTSMGNSNNYLTLANSGEDITFPFYIGNRDSRTRNSLNNLDFIRVAFPKYIERIPFFTGADLVINNRNYPLYKAEDINAIAFKTLRDRMLREMANSLLRLAIKKGIESYARKEDKTLGTIIGIFNAITEKADTRNWQTLPYAIYYNRIDIDENTKTVTLQLKTKNGMLQTQTIPVNIRKGTTKFISFNSLQ